MEPSYMIGLESGLAIAYGDTGSINVLKMGHEMML